MDAESELESRGGRMGAEGWKEPDWDESGSGEREVLRRKSWVIAMPMEAKASDVRSQARNVRSAFHRRRLAISSLGKMQVVVRT